jgi:hypothetical protein
MSTIYILRHSALDSDSRERFVGQIDVLLKQMGCGLSRIETVE